MLRRVALSLSLSLASFVGFLGTALAAGEKKPAPAPASNPYWDNVVAWLTQPIVLGILKGLGVLIGGWIAAKVIAWLIFKALCKTTWDDKLADKLGLKMLMSKKSQEEHTLERVVAKVVYYVLMLLVLVGALQVTGLTQVAAPIQSLAESFFRAVPAIAKAAVILLVAYVVGTILRKLIGATAGKLDTRFAEMTEQKDGSERTNFSESLGAVVFWLAMVFGLVGALDALAIESLSRPLSNALGQLVAVVPDLAKAALILVGGYILARIARVVVSNLLASIGADKVAAKLKLETLFAKHKLSVVLAHVVFYFIMVQATIAAFNALRLDTLSQPLANMMTQFWALLPAIAVAAVIVIVGVVVGRLVRGLVESVLKNLGFDKIMEKLGFGELASRNEKLNEPSEFVGLAVQVAIILLASAQALATLGLATWASYVNVFLGYVLQHVTIALVIVMVGFAIGNYVRDLITGKGDDESRRWIGSIARYAVLVFAFTMAVHHLDVAQSFVLIAFALLFGALCLALALAFGLGSQKVAGEIVARQVERARSALKPAHESKPPFDIKK